MACQIVAVVARKTGRDDTTIGGIFYHPSTGCYGRRKTGRRQRIEGEDCESRVGGFGEKSMSEQRLHQYSGPGSSPLV